VNAPTHLSSGSVVVSIDSLTAEDLQALLDLKRSEPERLRAVEDEQLRRKLWKLIRKMSEQTASEIAELLGDGTHPAVVLTDRFEQFLLAEYGDARTRAFGYSASVAA
jgi:hypothetical protein